MVQFASNPQVRWRIIVTRQHSLTLRGRVLGGSGVVGRWVRGEACIPEWVLESSWLEAQILIGKGLGCSCVHWEGALG